MVRGGEDRLYGWRVEGYEEEEEEKEIGASP